MKKIIHYCWFGDKPLPKDAIKCINSWRKFYPEYDIIEWNENNFDVNLTNFSKEAYSCKKWAFVADVARVFALKEYGGLYFDTDMQVIKREESLFKYSFFAGWDSDLSVAAGVLGACKSHPIINNLFDVYKKIKFDKDNMYAITIPKLLTEILKEYGLSNDYTDNLLLKEDIRIYSVDYFYPLSFDHSEKYFSDNTCMIHHYGGSWQTNKDKVKLFLIRTFGKKSFDFIKKYILHD